MKFSFKIFLRNRKLKKLLKEIEATTEACDATIKYVSRFSGRRSGYWGVSLSLDSLLSYNFKLTRRAELINQYRTIVEGR